jgi:hypothetical protein
MIEVSRGFGCMIGVTLVTLYWSSLTSLFIVILSFRGAKMDEILMKHLQRINHKISFWQWQLDYGRLNAEDKKEIQSEIESLKDEKSSLNAFRIS